MWSPALRFLLLSLMFSYVTALFWWPFSRPAVKTPPSDYGECQLYGDPATIKTPFIMKNGQMFNPNRLTAGHNDLPVGSFWTVTNLNNGKSVTVEITDGGPRVTGRIAYLSPAAFLAVADRDEQVFECTMSAPGAAGAGPAM